MISKEFFKYLEVVSNERDINLDELKELFSLGLSKAYNKEFNIKKSVVILNEDKGEILLYKQMIVVSEFKNLQDDNEEIEYNEILLEEARKIRKNCKVNDIIEIAVNPKEISRMAADTVKQIFNQGIKKIEKEKLFQHFKKFESKLKSVEVIKKSDTYFTVKFEKNITSLLPFSECFDMGNIEIGSIIKVIVKKVDMTAKGPKLFISRNDSSLISNLINLEIPEIQDGIIEIVSVSREAGVLSKVCVKSNDINVDAVGTIVGKGAQRIKSIQREVSDEKIEIFEYSENAFDLISNALSPVVVLDVLNLDVDNKKSTVIVPDHQLSLAIGKNGINVKLCVQVTGWNIDIKTEEELNLDDK